MPGGEGLLPGRGHRRRRVRQIPVFPLPGVVLFPGTLLPLHVFEPRYCKMVEDALAGEGVIGMTMITEQPPSSPLLSEPAVKSCGGAGRIIEHEMLEDGRYNILLEGSYRFRILEEVPSNPYRTMTIEEYPSIPFSSAAVEQAATTATRRLFEEVQAPLGLAPLPSEALSTERLCGELAIRLRWPSEALQVLLETDSLEARFDVILGRLVEWKQSADFLAPFRAETIDPNAN